MFPITASNSDQQYNFPLVDYTCKGSRIMGRGTCVAAMLVAEREPPTLVELHALKMSWQYRTHKTEAGNNFSHSRGTIPDNWQNFLARPVFSARYMVTQLDLPRSRMYNTECNTGKTIGDGQSARNVDFNLYITLNPVYTSIRKPRNVEEFKRAFLDCLESKQLFLFPYHSASADIRASRTLPLLHLWNGAPPRYQPQQYHVIQIRKNQSNQ